MSTVVVQDNSRQITITNRGSRVYTGAVISSMSFVYEDSILVGCGGVNCYQVVYVAGDNTVRPADGTNPTHAGRVIGFAKEIQLEGEIARVQHSGEIENPSWELEPGRQYFLTTGGEISETPSQTGFVQQVGVAKTPTKLIITLGDPVMR